MKTYGPVKNSFVFAVMAVSIDSAYSLSTKYQIKSITTSIEYVALLNETQESKVKTKKTIRGVLRKSKAAL
ncbi:hypothetical protein M513_08039 [Trichuris suis]|uniref:Uncharacterized protein n=1 Tax=Trichuris suis TaxID=68888 RepID=A0A085M1P3_9BILA|nr:hypothetical protein M513_08039 [Trichuris suis]